jgi:UDP-glucose 6-dehydrogenase
MVRRNLAAGRLRFTTDVEAAVAHGVLQFIAVGTPPDEDGSADLQYVIAAARNIGRHMDGYKVVVTSPPCRSALPTRCVPRSPKNCNRAARSSISASSPTRNSSRKARRSRTS